MASHVPRPHAMDSMLLWRNLSFGLGLLAGFLSLPKWQSLLGLAVALTYSYFAVRTY